MAAEEIKNIFLLRGLILTADHSASGGAGRFPDMPLTRAHAEKPFTDWKPRAHQAESEAAPPGSAILVAPTGSGKTEAALLWAARQMEHQPACRLFYTLPYQASMNAMYTRLAVKVLGYPAEAVKSGDADGITIRHSRALLKLYQDMMELDDADPRDASKQAKWLKNKADLNTYPIQIFSPYQMLKAAYSLKGYEALLLDYTGALFIFDEIHAYEPKRLALIIELMRWLREGFGARFFVMTATLPPMLRDRLTDALAPQTITATADEFIRSQRHTVEIVEGRLIDAALERVMTDYRAGQSVLVCLNRVADAQKVYRALMAHLPVKDLLLLHGRFNGRDRNRKEQALLQRIGVDTDRAERQPIICIATQVVEVSLNVDFDTLYTDPAPLEALLQRFGRVNRGRQPGSPLLPVHVFTQPSADGDKRYLPYDQTLVEDSLRVLTEYCAGRPIDEAQVTEMLGQIYSGATLAGWERDYADSAATFQRDILDAMKPFQSADKELQDRFYKMFDGIDVLPTSLEADYYDAIEAKRFLEARQYLVNISYQTYAEFKKYGRVVEARKLEGGYADHIDVEYSDEYGLNIDEARQAEKQRRNQIVTGEEGE
ncbi:MAG: CRISPR-associated helicase Cas3' [Anaerolineae bacterium]|nr:CRISPR-associated helicase Cas3' [Anaerolineae bacterium]